MFRVQFPNIKLLKLPVALYVQCIKSTKHSENDKKFPSTRGKAKNQLIAWSLSPQVTLH